MTRGVARNRPQTELVVRGCDGYVPFLTVATITRVANDVPIGAELLPTATIEMKVGAQLSKRTTVAAHHSDFTQRHHTTSNLFENLQKS